VYTEEKFEDEEDLRDRIRQTINQSGQKAGHERSREEADAVLQDLMQLAKQHGEIYPTMVEILKHYSQLLQRDVGM